MSDFNHALSKIEQFFGRPCGMRFSNPITYGELANALDLIHGPYHHTVLRTEQPDVLIFSRPDGKWEVIKKLGSNLTSVGGLDSLLGNREKVSLRATTEKRVKSFYIGRNNADYLQEPLPEADLHDGVAYCLENADEYCDGTFKHILRIFDTKGLVEERVLDKNKDAKFTREPQEYVFSVEKTADGVRTSVSQEIKDDDNPF